ncbi:MAG: RNA-binding protein [Candidatus Methanomethylophilaceae archaeon]|jgi:translin|nr:RNA-binding protein [Candidatus Methanomethylophilaceae archaeon]MDD3351216.1 RNA-binding protein [Candidatus Methanomethylophilaceae archaeon]MDD3986762.1 RNA-binding protein [Candidatus Methanomethylophilaceae archaeon]MDD4709296.1 RNA-binding protein [Candidatus Methanomethylophilaceae archaeon]NCA74403.1 RNA-binding protein [Gammaproteobacteria bacterium]
MAYSPMEGLSEGLESASEFFNRAEEHREYAIRSSRDIIRRSKKIIHSIHEGEDCSEDADKIAEEIRRLVSGLAEEPSVLYSGPAADAMSEYAEAAILGSMLEKGTVPTHTALGITEPSWALGLADSVGELRRVALKCLMSGDIERAINVYRMMEEVTDGLLMFDVPDAVAPMRRKQDIARGVMERTRSDIAIAVVMSEKRK